MRLIQGIFWGICIIFALFWGYRKVVNPFYTLSVPHFVTDSTKKITGQEDLNNLKNETLTLEEKISSTNKRLDDMLIFGGIIITLLLGINVGVYVNAERQVEKYFKDHFESHNEKVQKLTADAEQMVGKIKTEFELFQTFKSQSSNVKTPTE